MFCPKCARQAADEVKFCQQCGQPLGEVRKAMEGSRAARGGRRRGVRKGFEMVLASIVLLPLYPLVEALLGELIPPAENTRLDELPMELFGTFLLVLFLAGLARMLYAFLFEEKTAAASWEKSAPALKADAERQALPPSQSIPASDFAPRRVNTDDLSRPRPSVTDHTTRHLRRE